jgi:general stress protein 26
MRAARPHEQEAIDQLARLIEGMQVATLTTLHEDGTLRSRPMAVLPGRFQGDFWFFTRHDSPKAYEIEEDPRVSLSFSDFSGQKFISVTGEAELVRDRKKAEQLWVNDLRAWFPGGLSDPDLVLLRVHVDRAEYWDDRLRGMMRIDGFVQDLEMAS